MTLVDGNLIKEHLKNECQKYKLQLQGKEIAIIRFEVRENEDNQIKLRYEAARVSAEQKIKTFDTIGVTCNYIILPYNTPVTELQRLIYSINDNENIIAAIVQYPVPDQLQESIQLLSPSKDIDCVRKQQNALFQVPATSEGIVRIVESYSQINSNVAVVGGGGFIGQGIVNYLQKQKIECFILEKNDDKSLTREADIVVTITGKPGLTTPYILPQHRLVVDGGFTPGENKGDLPRGDVDRSAYNIPQNITPVPGGIGPTEMAILAERFVYMALGIKLNKWNYQELQQQQLEYSSNILPVAYKLFTGIKNINYQQISRPQNGIEVIRGENYKLTLNINQNTFSVSRANEKLELIKVNLDNNQTEIARGLTESDVSCWQEIEVENPEILQNATEDISYNQNESIQQEALETVSAVKQLLKFLDENEFESANFYFAQTGDDIIITTQDRSREILRTADNIVMFNPTPEDSERLKQLREFLHNNLDYQDPDIRRVRGR
ncbi:tetrahydrofolate dehydrogenase (plasmid) [Nostoc sp. CENA543]|uniref:tetrahydrofolate dehydrogenase/cyclohydrolase catalytic domain-containing protein n=1 Tax=Nostoc sp. CENA543 TaxID=1869241 RepID=UPI000CA0A3E2|nr:tetrahydrofolate dehydrogenase/cyclohydrolase catalytic domain-containing protein [Nostoc sp. CENA543]AUT04626.1 tetrahydrofolate dehydrogenase [Nostoc sp. CENA543]